MQGISTRKTKLGWNVIRIHYSADPDKNPNTAAGAAWLASAKSGLSDARWRKEYEIDYGALGGQLVFPMFDESIHVVPGDLEELSPQKFTIWLGADPHPRTPDAFLWLGIDSNGEMSVVCSWWPEENKLVRESAATIKAVHEGFPGLRPRYQVMDVAGANFNVDEEHNFFDSYRNEGLYFQRAKRNMDLSGYELIAAALTPTEFVVGNEKKQRPRLTIWDGCGDNAKLIHQIKNLRYREWKGNVDDKDPPEEPRQKERHLIDCLSYILLDEPRFIRPRKHQPSARAIYGGGKIPGGTGY